MTTTHYVHINCNVNVEAGDNYCAECGEQLDWASVSIAAGEHHHIGEVRSA